MSHDYRDAGAHIPVPAAERDVYLLMTIVVYIIITVVNIPGSSVMVVVHNPALYRCRMIYMHYPAMIMTIGIVPAIIMTAVVVMKRILRL